MQELLFKLLKKRTAKVEIVTPEILKYEDEHPQWKVAYSRLAHNGYDIGLEIEIERITNHSPTEYGVWSARGDGSLRDSGMEFVSSPIRGQRIEFALNQFFGSLKQQKYNFSPRTSIHVHLNALDMYPHQIGGLLMTYLAFEKLLYAFVGGDREQNNFCVPLLDVVLYSRLIHNFVDENFQVPIGMQHHRYLGLNVDAIRKFGSLEFRHLGGTDDKSKIINWINLIFCLKTFAMTNGWEAIKTRIDALNTNSSYQAFFNDVWGQYGYLLNAVDLKRDMEYAVTKIKKFLIPNAFVMEVMNTVSSPDCVWYNFLLGKPRNQKLEHVFENKQVARRQPRNVAPRAAFDPEAPLFRDFFPEEMEGVVIQARGRH